MNSLQQFAQNQILSLKAQALYRWRENYVGAQDVVVNLQGKSFLNFSSNNYLGLANHPKLIDAIKTVVLKVGVGAGASHMVIGDNQLHLAAEQALAEFVGVQRCLLFSTGYMANVGIIPALVTKQDYLFQDKLNHASLIQGGVLSGANMRRYPHLDYDILQNWLHQVSAKSVNKLVVSDSVFSMEGDIASIPTLIEATKHAGAWLMVDDAHGFGVLGHCGKGILSHFSINPNSEDTPLYIATLSKALGVFGAFVGGNNEVIEYLMQTTKSYIYTTAMPPMLARAILAGLKLLTTESWRQQKLNENIDYFKSIMQSSHFEIANNITPIQTIMLYDEALTVKCSKLLYQKGILAMPIRTPSVPKGKARIRIALSANHSKAQIEYLKTALEWCQSELQRSNSKISSNFKECQHG